MPGELQAEPGLPGQVQGQVGEERPLRPGHDEAEDPHAEQLAAREVEPAAGAAGGIQDGGVAQQPGRDRHGGQQADGRDERPPPAVRDRDRRQDEAGQQSSDRDSGLLDAEEEAESPAEPACDDDVRRRVDAAVGEPHQQHAEP